MAVDDAALDRLREDLLVAIRAAILDSEHRVRGEIAGAVSASEQGLRGEMSASEQRLRGEISALEHRIGGQISALEHRIGGEISALEHRIGGEVADAISASEIRLEGRLEARLGARIDASAAETRRHMGVVAEDLTSKIALVAEGVITLTQRLGAEMSDGFDLLDRRLLRLETRLLSSPEQS